MGTGPCHGRGITHKEVRQTFWLRHSSSSFKERMSPTWPGSSEGEVGGHAAHRCSHNGQLP